MCWLKVRHYNGCGCNMLLEYKPCEVVKKNPTRKFTCGHLEEVVERRTKSCNQGEEITSKKACPHDRHIAGRRDERALVKWPAHVIIPVAETSREDRSESSAQPGTPIKSGNKYDQSTPVKTSKNPIRSTSVISSNSPQRSMPVNAGNSPERSMPVNAPNSPERSVPVNAGNSPERGMPVNAGNKPDGIRIPSFQITDHGELVKDQERRQEEHAGAMQRDIHTHERAFGEKSEYQESSASLDNASQGDAPMTSEDESGTLKRPLSGPSEDRDSSKRHKSVHENEDEEEVLMED